MTSFHPEKVLDITRIITDDLCYQVELVELRGLYVWAISFGTPDQCTTITGEAYSPIQALAAMRSLMLSVNDTGNDILYDIKNTIESLSQSRQSDGDLTGLN